MNNENLFVALVFYGLRRCGVFGKNKLISLRSSRHHVSLFVQNTLPLFILGYI